MRSGGQARCMDDAVTRMPGSEVAHWSLYTCMKVEEININFSE